MGLKREGNCLFIFARVCRGWRKAQLKVGGPLRTRVESDVLLPGQAELAKWALAEGCPRKRQFYTTNMAHEAALYGHRELVQWLCGEGGFAMDEKVVMNAAGAGDLELVRWLRANGCPLDATASAFAGMKGRLEVLQWLAAEGCPLDSRMCHHAVEGGHVEVLRWAREKGCPWTAFTRDQAAELGYTDDYGNLVASPWSA